MKHTKTTNMADLIYIVGLFFLATPFLTCAVPIPPPNSQNIPWAHPCTPNKELQRNDNHAVLPKYNIVYLIENTGMVRELIDSLLGTFEEIIADKEVLRLLQKKLVNAFPIANLSHDQKEIDMYKRHFSQLSKAAVFLEQIYLDENNEDLQFRLNDLFRENLHQMCEIHLAIDIHNSQLPPPASRSIMPLEYRNLETTYQHYQRNYKIVYQYKLLLESHLDEYRQMKKKEDSLAV